MSAEQASAVALLFARGARPDAAAIHALAAEAGGFSVTHQPADEAAGWLELLVNGLAFDLAGLADGPPATAPPARHRFECADDSRDGLEALLLRPGPHLAGGEAMPPIVRSHLALALDLAELAGLAQVAWIPGQSRMGADYFKRVVSAWLVGGPFPGLGLTAVTPAFDGALQSEGLGFFTGQELWIEPELAEDRVAATRLALRLIDELVAHGTLSAPLQVTAPEGETLALEPSPNGAFVRVRRA